MSNTMTSSVDDMAIRHTPSGGACVDLGRLYLYKDDHGNLHGYLTGKGGVSVPFAREDQLVGHLSRLYQRMQEEL